MLQKGKFKFILVVVLAAVLSASTLCACQPSQEVEDTSFLGYQFEQVQAQNIPVTYTPLNMATPYMVEQGIYGDGCQWPVSFESSADGSLMMYGIDVAGMYRSVDHGVTWQKCNTGVTNRGIGMFGIDPKNSNHLLATGLSGSSAKNTGMYISYDGGETWKPTGFNVKIGGERYLWDGLEFDPTSFDAQSGVCKVAYYSIPYQRDRTTRKNAYQLSTLESPIKNGEQGLYKSSDGGESFVQISSDERLADGILKITANGKVFVGNQHGLFNVSQSGEILNSWFLNSFQSYESDKITITLSDGKTADILKCYLGVTGLDCVGNTLYVQTWDGIFTLDVSKNEVATPQKITGDGYKSQNWPQFLAVSQSNPNHLVYQYRGRVDKVSWDTYWTNYIAVSFDGGASWTTATADAKTVFTNGGWASREKVIIVDPSDDNNVLCLGSDTIMRSSDGGLNFVQASGVSNMMCGGKMHFNYFDDTIVFASAQDYGGTVSLDGGKTFKRVLVSANGTSYGSCYDGFAADAYTYFCFARKGWTAENELVVTFDGGASWTHTGIIFDYGQPTNSLQSYNNPDILFAGGYRSDDRGKSWKRMQGCACVCTVSYGEGHPLLGYDEKHNIVVSHDDGKSWQLVFDAVNQKFNDGASTVSETIRDISFDHVNNIVYASVTTHHKGSGGNEYNSQRFYKITLDNSFKAVERKALKAFDNPDGYENLTDIEVDPNATNVVYVACAGNYFSNRYALQRSIDGGETWQVLTSNTDTDPATKGLCTNRGGYEASMLAVQPATGKVLVGCGCYGFEWITPPYDSAQLSHTPPQQHKVVFVCDGKTVHTEDVKNNRTFSYIYDEEGKTFDGWYTDSALTKRWREGTLVYNSTVLYAKMKKAQQLVCYVNGKEFFRHDLEDYDADWTIPVPQVSGYTFGGWFADEGLKTPAQTESLSKSTNIYAGFYKTGQNVFDATQQDFAAYLQYSNHKLSSVERVANDQQVDNRCAFVELEQNCSYLVTFTMDVRCRYGLNKNDFVANRAPDVYFVDESDVNGSDPVGKQVTLVFNSGDYTKMLLFYYTSNSQSGIAFEEIRKTIGCYKLVDTDLHYILNR